jgi:hypothetical protein
LWEDLAGSNGNLPCPKEIVSFEELLMLQVAQQKAITRLLIKKGIFTMEEFLGMVKVVDREMKRKLRYSIFPLPSNSS